MICVKLSEHFYLREFLHSETAARLGRDIEAPPETVINLTRLCEFVLEPARVQLGRPIVVLSGYRPLWLNEAVGGSKTSEHLQGRAADILVPGMTPAAVAKFLSHRLAVLPINQVILEFPTSSGGGWTHVSVCATDAQPRRQLLTAVKQDGRTVYSTGLPLAA